MKKNFANQGSGFKKMLLAALFSFCLFLPRLAADPLLDTEDLEPVISMDFQDANLKDILKIFSIQSGMNFIASEAVQDRKLTLYLDKVPLREAMNKLFKANNLSYELDKVSNIFVVKDWGKLEIETTTQIFFLKYATVSTSSLKQEMSQVSGAEATFSSTSGSSSSSSSGSSSGGSGGKWSKEEDAGITRAVKKLLSKAGSVIEDFRTNSLIITDAPNTLAVIAKVIAALDVPAPQVILEVEMLDVSKNVVDAIGFKFGQTPFTAVITGASGNIGFPFKSWSKTFFGDSSRGSMAIDSGSNTYQVQLDFLRTHTGTKFLARPRLLTLNNETAEIKIVTQEAIGVKTTTTSAEGSATQTEEAERSETGVSLRVTPQVNMDTGEITMFIVPTVAEAATGGTFTVSGSRSITFKDPEVRSTKSTVRIRDGETVVIGGLIRNEINETITKVPILGDIPFLGKAFTHKNKTKDKERELLVFITPRVVSEAGVTNKIDLAKAKMNTLPAREQNTASGLRREAVISSSLNKFEKPR